VPAAVELPTVMDNVDEPEAVNELGLKLGVAPLGNPLALKLTVPVNPLE